MVAAIDHRQAAEACSADQTPEMPLATTVDDALLAATTATAAMTPTFPHPAEKALVAAAETAEAAEAATVLLSSFSTTDVRAARR